MGFVFYAGLTTLQTLHFMRKPRVIRSTVHSGSNRLEFRPCWSSSLVHILSRTQGLNFGFPTGRHVHYHHATRPHPSWSKLLSNVHSYVVLSGNQPSSVVSKEESVHIPLVAVEFFWLHSKSIPISGRGSGEGTWPEVSLLVLIVW